MHLLLEDDFSVVSDINTEKGVLGLKKERTEMQENMILFSFWE